MWYYYCPHCGYLEGSALHRPDCPYYSPTKQYYSFPIYDTEDEKGWICPRCNRVWGPMVYECEVCNGTACKCGTEKDIVE
jgi:hypothetical protein